METEKRSISSIFKENPVIIIVSPLTRFLLRVIILPEANQKITTKLKVQKMIFFILINVPLTIGLYGYVYKGLLGEK